jgi:glycosidase
MDQLAKLKWRSSRLVAGALVVVILLAVLAGCATWRAAPGVHGQAAAGTVKLQPSWVQDGLVYELFVRDFTPEGSFRAIIPRLPEIRELGVQTIWLMPIHPIGEIKRKGTLGSPYSITDYYSVHPDYGTLEDFAALVDAIHAEGLDVIMDLVVNHTAWDHPWVREHPEWYTRDAQGNMMSPLPDWSDVADLNFENAALREELVRIMTFWVSEFDVDGYRVDTASMVPIDFWAQGIAAVQAVKPVLFLAESSDVSLREAGFELFYDWQGYGRLKEAFAGGRADVFTAAAAREVPPGGAFLRFITNHDETAWDAPPPVLFGSPAAARAAAVAELFLPGVPLLYNGQEIGNDESWAFFEKWDYDWNANPETRAFYAALGNAWQHTDALRSGGVEVVRGRNGRNVISYLRRVPGETVLVAVNIRGNRQEAALPQEYHGTWTDLLTGRTVSLDGQTVLDPFEFLVLR